MLERLDPRGLCCIKHDTSLCRTNSPWHHALIVSSVSDAPMDRRQMAPVVSSCLFIDTLNNYCPVSWLTQGRGSMAREWSIILQSTNLIGFPGPDEFAGGIMFVQAYYIWHGYKPGSSWKCRHVGKIIDVCSWTWDGHHVWLQAKRDTRVIMSHEKRPAGLQFGALIENTWLNFLCCCNRQLLSVC